MYSSFFFFHHHIMFLLSLFLCVCVSLWSLSFHFILLLYHLDDIILKINRNLVGEIVSLNAAHISIIYDLKRSKWQPRALLHKSQTKLCEMRVFVCAIGIKHNKTPMKIKSQPFLTMVQPLLLDSRQEFKHSKCT